MSSSRGQLQIAATCLLASVIWDAADGFLARRWNVASEFGAQLDSLADMTSFNIAGSLLTYYWFSPPANSLGMGLAASLYAVMGACRLARFNSGPKLTDEFQGMPTTAVAFMVALTCLTCPSLDENIGLGLVVTLALLMVSHFPYPKLVKILNCPPWAWATLLGLARYSFVHTTWACMAAYVLSGPAIGILRGKGDKQEWTVQSPQLKG